MFRHFFICTLLLVVIIGCKNESKNSNSYPDETAQRERPFKRAFSDGDYNFQLEYDNRLDTSYLDVLYKGKKNKSKGIQRYGER